MVEEMESRNGGVEWEEIVNGKKKRDSMKKIWQILNSPQQFVPGLVFNLLWESTFTKLLVKHHIIVKT